jgi:hypothetical protein
MATMPAESVKATRSPGGTAVNVSLNGTVICRRPSQMASRSPARTPRDDTSPAVIDSWTLP